MKKRLSKRQFLKLLALTASGGGALWLSQILKVSDVEAFTGLRKIYMPLITKDEIQASSTSTTTSTSTSTPTSTFTSTPKVNPSLTQTSTSTKTRTPTSTSTPTSTRTPTATSTNGIPPGSKPRVVHVYDPDATSWDFQSGWYGDYVDQNVVNNMMDQGIKQLTGLSTVAAAWQNILPGYSSGKGIAVKVNFNNNATGCSDTSPRIDALVHPFNALIRGLKSMGVQESDIWVYDATRGIPARFRNPCHSLYPGVRIYSCGGPEPNFTSSDPNATIHFYPPSGTQMPTIKLTDVLLAATYVINMPIMKNHGDPGVSLTFKNHFGSIDHPFDLHPYIISSDSRYSSNYNPLVDIYKNPNICNKVCLTIADGLYAAETYNATPGRWSRFGNDSPNSLFLSKDPVAVDCVMFDILKSQWNVIAKADDYLRLASNAGLGTFEHGDPWGSGYNSIDYLKLSL
jgi:hypothetical protein